MLFCTVLVKIVRVVKTAKRTEQTKSDHKIKCLSKFEMISLLQTIKSRYISCKCHIINAYPFSSP